MRAELGSKAGGRWPLAGNLRLPPATHHWPPATCLLPLFLGLLLAGLGTGCRMVRDVATVPGQTVRAVTPGKKDKHTADPMEVQQDLLRFADEFTAVMITGVEKLRRGTNSLDSAEMLQRKLAIGTEISAIASGPNAVGNLLDMTIFVSVARMAMEEYWQPKVFGDSALPMLEDCRIAETNIWRLAGEVLKPEQQAELRAGIEAWHRQNPHMENLLAARALGVASEVVQANRAGASKPDSVFNLRVLDPLAGLDPAVRELAQTRLLAERALFVTQRMPTLLRWQTELFTVNAVALPAVVQLVTNTTQIAASVDRFARVAEQLPGQLSAERAEILKALDSQEKTLTPLVNEVRQTLTVGSQMSTSLNTTIMTFDALMKRFGVGEPSTNAPPDTNSPPFNILDYAQTAGQFEKMARQLTEMLVTLDRTIGSTNLAQLSTQLSPAVAQAQARGKEIVDYAFWKGIILLVFVLVGGLTYRLVAARLARVAPNRTG